MRNNQLTHIPSKGLENNVNLRCLLLENNKIARLPYEIANLRNINALNVSDKKALFVSADYDENVFMSARNISSVLTSVLSDVNTYDLVNSDILLLTESAAKMFSEEEQEVEA